MEGEQWPYILLVEPEDNEECQREEKDWEPEFLQEGQEWDFWFFGKNSGFFPRPLMVANIAPVRPARLRDWRLSWGFRLVCGFVFWFWHGFESIVSQKEWHLQPLDSKVGML